MRRHHTNSWEKEWDFQPNLQRAKDDWLDPVTPTYACPPRDGRSERRNAARARQDAALGVSLTKDPAWKRKFIPTSEREALRYTQTHPRHRTDPVVRDSTNGTVLVKKSVYKPHSGGRQASSPPRGHSPNGSYPRGRSAPRGGSGGPVYDGNGGEGAHQMAQEEREFGNHPPQSMERMYRETVRNRRNEHLRNNDHVEPEWEHQREIMDVVGAKSAEDLIDEGYDSRYRQPGTMLDVRRDRRVMSQNDRSSMAYRMFPENYKRLQGHDYDESTFGRDEANTRNRNAASSRRAASAHNSRAATNETLSRSTSSRQGRQQQQEADLQRGNSRWEEEQGRSAYHALGNTTAISTAQPAHRRAPSKRVISGFHDDREEQDAKMRRDQLDAADQRTRMINQSYDQASAPHLSEMVSPTHNRYGSNRGRGGENNNSSFNGGNSSFVNNIRSTTGNHINMPTYSSPVRGGGMDHQNRSSHNHTSSMRTPYGGADLSAGAASFYGDRLAAHKPFTYSSSTPYQEVWSSSSQAPHYHQAPPASESFVAHSYDRFADVVSRFGPNSPMRGTENSYYPHQHQAAQPTMQTRSSYYNGDSGPIVVTTSAPPTVLHSSIPRGMGATTHSTMMATPLRNTTIGPLHHQPPMTMPAGSGSPNSGTPSVYCATGHFYIGGGEGSPPRGVSFVEPVSMVVSHNIPQQHGTSLQESSAFSPHRRQY